MVEAFPSPGQRDRADKSAEPKGWEGKKLDTSIQAVADRVSSMLETLASIGRDSGGGVSRLAFTREEREAHAFAVEQLTDLGLHVRVDEVGNTIAERPGQRAGLGAIGAGSHLDTVPYGGRFDGTVGVVSAIEMIRLMVENDIQTNHPVRVVVFAAEEGARFGEPCIGSKSAAHLLSDSDFYRLRDTGGVSLADAMVSVDLDPSRAEKARWNQEEWTAFLEVHIEQGRVLETENCTIGLVDMVSGSTRLLLDLYGQVQHSGGTPMNLRSDALTAAAEVVLVAEHLAKDPRHRGTRATVGRLDVHPNSITTIPGFTSLTVDVRDVDSDRQRRTAEEIVERASRICQHRGVRLVSELIADSSPVALPLWLRNVISDVCQDIGIRYRVLASGASHDAQMINRIVPAGIIFVPSREGLSHIPDEWTSVTDILVGTRVLLSSILRLDAFLLELSE